MEWLKINWGSLVAGQQHLIAHNNRLQSGIILQNPASMKGLLPVGRGW